MLVYIQLYVYIHICEHAYIVVYKEYIMNVHKYKARCFKFANIKNTDVKSMYKSYFAFSLIKSSIIGQKKNKY